jgi:hypothetical protein
MCFRTLHDREPASRSTSHFAAIATMLTESRWAESIGCLVEE